MKIKVLSKKQIITKDGKEKTFYRYFTPVKIRVIDSDGSDLGIQDKNLEIHFTKSAMKKVKDEKIFSIFECKGEDVGFPYVYKVPKDKTSDDEWSKNHVWIRDFISETEIPYEPQENTCSFVVDEEETESVEIVEEN